MGVNWRWITRRIPPPRRLARRWSWEGRARRPPSPPRWQSFWMFRSWKLCRPTWGRGSILLAAAEIFRSDSRQNHDRVRRFAARVVAFGFEDLAAFAADPDVRRAPGIFPMR